MAGMLDAILNPGRDAKWYVRAAGPMIAQFIFLLAISAGTYVSETMGVRRTYWKPAVEFATKHTDELVLQFIFVVIIALTGIALFQLRTWRRRLYALGEMFVGIAAATYAANEFMSTGGNTQVKAVFAALAGLYIIVRGLDNWQQGAKKKSAP